MPKVSEAYIKQKREAILDAALHVFQNKPLYEMTMLDVIKEAGVSRGGIYKYFDNIDDVIVAMVNRMTAENRLKDGIDEIVAQTKDAAEAIEALLAFLGVYIQRHVHSLGKVQFELTVLVSNHPEKAGSILPRLTEQEAGQYLIQILFRQIVQGVEQKEFEPRFATEEILAFIGTQIDGLLRNVVLICCYGAGGKEPNEGMSMRLLTSAVFHMLGVQE